MKRPYQRKMNDQETTAYFDAHTPKWSPGRYRDMLTALSQMPNLEQASLIDIGCGSGNILAFIRQKTAIQKVVGLDPSPNYLELVGQQLGCETILGSVLDPNLVAQHRNRFDLAVMGDVLHHLVGNSRAASRRYAQQAIANALEMVVPAGTLFIAEPLFYPRLIPPLVFYVKLFVTRFVTTRLSLSQQWINFGAPVVSFLNPPQLKAIIAQTPTAHLQNLVVSRVKPLALGVRRARMTAIVQKQA